MPRTSQRTESGFEDRDGGHVVPAQQIRRPKPPGGYSCVDCRRRKCKCDNGNPCGACLRSNIRCQPSNPIPNDALEDATVELNAVPGLPAAVNVDDATGPHDLAAIPTARDLVPSVSLPAVQVADTAGVTTDNGTVVSTHAFAGASYTNDPSYAQTALGMESTQIAAPVPILHPLVAPDIFGLQAIQGLEAIVSEDHFGQVPTDTFAPLGTFETCGASTAEAVGDSALIWDTLNLGGYVAAPSTFASTTTQFSTPDEAVLSSYPGQFAPLMGQYATDVSNVKVICGIPFYQSDHTAWNMPPVANQTYIGQDYNGSTAAQTDFCLPPIENFSYTGNQIGGGENQLSTVDPTWLQPLTHVGSPLEGDPSQSVNAYDSTVDYFYPSQFYDNLNPQGSTEPAHESRVEGRFPLDPIDLPDVGDCDVFGDQGYEFHAQVDTAYM